MELCIEGEKTIPRCKKILNLKLGKLENDIRIIQESIDFIKWKQVFYDDILSGKIKYYSNLTSDNDEN